MADRSPHLEQHIERVKREHGHTPTTSAAGIERFEQRSGLRLPDDIRLFYMHCDGARLFGAEYVIPDPDGLLPMKMIMSSAVGRPVDLPASWYGICRTRSGDWAGVSFGGARTAGAPILHCYALDSGPATGYRVVAENFTDFLGRALASSEHPFWHARATAGLPQPR